MIVCANLLPCLAIDSKSVIVMEKGGVSHRLPECVFAATHLRLLTAGLVPQGSLMSLCPASHVTATALAAYLSVT